MLAGDPRNRRHWDASLLDVLRSGDVRWSGYRLLQEGVPTVQIVPAHHHVAHPGGSRS